MKFVLMALALCAWATGWAAERFVATVLSVEDGDTVWLQRGAERVKVRLFGIDAPEIAHGSQRGQPWGTESRDALARLMPVYSSATCLSNGLDVHGRTLCRLLLPNNLNINLEMVRGGHAWVYTRYTKDPALYGAQKQASELRLGLWSRAPAVEPEAWRRDCWRSQELPAFCTGTTVATTPAVPRQMPSDQSLWQQALRFVKARL